MSKQKATVAEALEKQKLEAVDKLSRNIDAADDKQILLGLIFLK